MAWDRPSVCVTNKVVTLILGAAKILFCEKTKDNPRLFFYLFIYTHVKFRQFDDSVMQFFFLSYLFLLDGMSLYQLTGDIWTDS